MTSLGAPVPLVAMAKGTSRLIKISVTDEDGNPFDMTGGNAVFWVGKCADSSGADIVIQKETGGGGITLNGSVGSVWTVEVVIAPVDTDDLPPRASYYCECRVWDQFDQEYVIAAGAFELDPSLTVSAAEP